MHRPHDHDRPCRTSTAGRLRAIRTSLAACALAALATGCSSMGAVGYAPGASLKTVEGGLVSEHDRGVDYVWSRTKETLAHLSERVPQFDEAERSAFATLDEGSVRAEVTDVAPGSSRLTVKARRYGKESPELAREVLDRIGEEIER